MRSQLLIVVAVLASFVVWISFSAPATLPVPAAVQGRPSLAVLLDKSGTDKFYLHGYHRYYEGLLAPYRDLPGVRLLEIGVLKGESLKTWVDYFSNVGAVHGLAYRADAAKARKLACEGIQDCKLDIFSLDQSDPKALEEMISKQHTRELSKSGASFLWDIIIDDGSHIPMHQLTSFKHLFPHVRYGGLYVIEDIESSFTDHGHLYHYDWDAGIFAEPGKSAVEKFKELVEVVNRKHFGQPQYTVFGEEVDGDVAEVRFLDGMIAVLKKPADPEWEKYPDMPELVFQKSKWPKERGMAVAQEKLAGEIPIP